MDILCECIPKSGGRAAKGSKSYGVQMRWCIGKEGGRCGSECMGESVYFSELDGVWKSGFMADIENQEQDIKINREANREPMKMFEDRSDLLCDRGFGRDVGSWNLDKLKFIEGFLW